MDKLRNEVGSELQIGDVISSVVNQFSDRSEVKQHNDIYDLTHDAYTDCGDVMGDEGYSEMTSSEKGKLKLGILIKQVIIDLRR